MGYFHHLSRAIKQNRKKERKKERKRWNAKATTRLYTFDMQNEVDFGTSGQAVIICPANDSIRTILLYEKKKDAVHEPNRNKKSTTRQVLW